MSVPIGAAIWLLLHATGMFAAPVGGLIDVERGAGAEDCPDGSALDRALDRLIGTVNAPAPDEARAVRAAVTFSRGATGYQATLRFGGAKEGQRTLTDTGPTCEALGRAVAITIALVLDATAEPPATTRDAPPQPTPSPEIAVARQPVAPPAPPRSGVLSLLGGAAVGLVGAPSTMGGVAFSVGMARRLLVEAAGVVVAPRTTTFDPGTVQVELLAARLSACATVNLPESRWPVGLCARVVGGRLRGTGSGFPAANVSQDLAFWALGGGLQVQHAMGKRLIVGAEATLLAPLRTTTFSVGNRGVAYESAVLAAMLQLAVGVALW